LENAIPVNERFVEHIDLCLTCRACERVCPNKVCFSELITKMRERIASARPQRRRVLGKLARAAVMRPRLLTMFAPLLVLARLSHAGRFLPRASQAETWLSALALVRFRKFYPARGIRRGEVAMFLGCVARLFDGETLRSAIMVLNDAGFDVRIPVAQTCCGALSRQAGDLREATRLAERNARAFRDAEVVVTTASGCEQELREYKRKDSDFSDKVIDIGDFLAKTGEWTAFAPLDASIAMHQPCTGRPSAAVEELLKKIPGAKVTMLPGNEQCCGAAGVYFLKQPQMAESLRQDKVDAFKRSRAQLVATSNIGCAMHLRATGIEALHPVTLLARQSARS
jgi:glycolate oxidase iron-sulfur subunit